MLRQTLKILYLTNRSRPNIRYVTLGNNSFAKKETWQEKEQRQIALRSEFFENMKDKNRQAFLDALDLFENSELRRRGHIDFIYAALKHLKEFGAHKDIEAYKKLMNLFPKEKYVVSNPWQEMLHHYPKHQDCGIEILEVMQKNRVMIDRDLELLVVAVFGYYGRPYRKFLRMAYWQPKFKNLTPFKLPEKLPDSALELAVLAVRRMCSIDLLAEVDIYHTADHTEICGNIHTWIVSGQSETQQDLIRQHPLVTPIYVEGPFIIWLNDKCITYFILRARADVEDLRRRTVEPDLDDVSNLDIPIGYGVNDGQLPPKTALIKPPSIHEQEDGTILGICATGSSDKNSLLAWVRLLQESNPRLGEIPLLFMLKSRTDCKDVVTVNHPRDWFYSTDGEFETETKTLGGGASLTGDNRS